MHLYLSMLAGKSLTEDSCISTSIENRNFRWVTTNFRGYLLFDGLEFLIIVFTHHLLLISFPFTIVCLGKTTQWWPSCSFPSQWWSSIITNSSFPADGKYPSRHFVLHNKQRSCKQISHTLVESAADIFFSRKPPSDPFYPIINISQLSSNTIVTRPVQNFPSKNLMLAYWHLAND
jgi:hypothetical protein